jgi:hypothetical protein
LLGTLPTTIVPAAAGIYAGTAVADYQAAMSVAPAGMLLNALFLYTWRAVPPRLPNSTLRVRLALMTAISLLAWLVGAALAVVFAAEIRSSSIPLPLFGWSVTAMIGAVGWLACRHAPPAPAGRHPVGWAVVVARGVLAATAIGAAVLIAGVGGPLVAGIVAVFPAIFITTMVSLWLSQGEAVPAGAVGPMMLGSTSVALYSLLAVWTLPRFGVAAGSALAWVASAGLVTVPAWLYLTRLSLAWEQEGPE